MSGESPEISVVVALRDRLDLTRTFLVDLERTLAGVPHEVVLVDDGSTDGTRDFLRERQGGGLRAVFQDENRGFAAANNRGAREARAPRLAFLNNDLVLREGWFEPMRAALDGSGGMVGNVQTNAHTGRIDHAGIVFTPWGIPEHWGQGYLRIPGRGARRFRAVTAACCLVRRELFLGEGGFDEAYRNGFEDIDLCLRLDARGHANRVALESRVGHWVSASPGRKGSDAENIRLFLSRWGGATRRWGLRDWPRHYLRRHLRRPWRLNGPKTIDALLLLARLRNRAPAWMERRYRALAETGGPA